MDQETFIGMVRQSQNTYYRVARSILSKEEDAEDAVQEGILKAWQKRNKLKDESLFRTWSTRIVINACYDMIRKNKPLLFFWGGCSGDPRFRRRTGHRSLSRFVGSAAEDPYRRGTSLCGRVHHRRSGVHSENSSGNGKESSFRRPGAAEKRFKGG